MARRHNLEGAHASYQHIQQHSQVLGRHDVRTTTPRSTINLFQRITDTLCTSDRVALLQRVPLLPGVAHRESKLVAAKWQKLHIWDDMWLGSGLIPPHQAFGVRCAWIKMHCDAEGRDNSLVHQHVDGYEWMDGS